MGNEGENKQLGFGDSAESNAAWRQKKETADPVAPDTISKGTMIMKPRKHFIHTAPRENSLMARIERERAKQRDNSIKREKEKVCIVGCSDSKTLAPFKDTSYEFWGVNNLFLTMPDVPWSRWFEIHEITFNGRNFLRRGKRVFRGLDVNTYMDKISRLSCPVYMQKAWECIPHVILYPLDTITSIFGRYLTNTISYQIALAIYLGYETIAIYGVDMAVSTEYYKQRPSCEYFIGIGRGLGIDIYVPDEADLLKTRYLYAFEEQKEDAFQKKINHTMLSLQQRRNQATIQRDHLGRQVEQYIGAELTMTEMSKIWESCK